MARMGYCRNRGAESEPEPRKGPYVTKRATKGQSDDSVTHLIGGLKRADEEAVAALWGRYFDKLVLLARRWLNGTPRRAADEEDVALSVFKSLCGRAARGDFSRLDDRDDLWRLLVTITHRKAAEAARGANRKKRSPRGWREVSIGQIAATDPSPATLAILDEEQRRLLALLPDDACRQVVRWKLEGFKDLEIAEKLEVTDRTVRRKMKLIRAVWGEALQGPVEN